MPLDFFDYFIFYQDEHLRLHPWLWNVCNGDTKDNIRQSLRKFIFCPRQFGKVYLSLESLIK